MLDVEANFAELLGRQPTEKEIQSLYRAKNALNIRDNDALWLVLMALESYDTLYRKYPEMISGQVSKIVDEQRVVMAAIADAETKKALGSLADTIARTSESIADRLVEASRWLSWGWAWFAATAFGTLCMFVGFVLGSGRLPFWAEPNTGQSMVSLVLGTMARTPAGWIASVGAAACALGALWHARNDVAQGRRLRLVFAAAGLLVLAIFFLIALF